MTKKYKTIIFLAGFLLVMSPQIVLAVNPAAQKLDDVATVKGPYAPVGETTLTYMIGTAVGIGLGLLGVVFLGLMLYAGYNWMTARGDEEKVGRAKDIITQAIIGLIIVVGAYASWVYLFRRLF